MTNYLTIKIYLKKCLAKVNNFFIFLTFNCWDNEKTKVGFWRKFSFAGRFLGHQKLFSHFFSTICQNSWNLTKIYYWFQVNSWTNAKDCRKRTIFVKQINAILSSKWIPSSQSCPPRSLSSQCYGKMIWQQNDLHFL